MVAERWLPREVAWNLGARPGNNGAVQSRRGSRRVVTDGEPEKHAAYATEYVAKVEAGTTGESTVLCFDVKGDYCRNLAELAPGDAESKAAQEVACARDAKMAEKDLVVAHHTRLSLTLDFLVFQHEVFENADEACRTARAAFEGADLTCLYAVSPPPPKPASADLGHTAAPEVLRQEVLVASGPLLRHARGPDPRRSAGRHKR